MRKIYLEGQLGQKFGSSHLFCGDTPADAFRLIGTNYPEFRKYLIECHENDIGFHVEVNNEEIDITECLLPLSKGDIVITPVPAGSKSGGAKILAAIALTYISFGLSNVVYAQQIAMLSGSGSTALASAAGYGSLISASLAINLALTGIQQLMAPDPATDQQNEEGYLFTGDARNVVEGDPVPVLYGELRVPGIPISTEVLPNTSTANFLGVHSSDYDNNIDYGLTNADWMLALYEMRKGTGDQGRTSTLSINSVKDPAGRSQNILTTSVISEGPIYGLVNGASSVYLNNDPAMDPVDSNTGSKATVSLTSGSASGTATNISDAHVTSTEDNTTARGIIENYATGSVVASYLYYRVDTGFSEPYYTAKSIRLVSSSALFSSDMTSNYSKKIDTKIRILDTATGETVYEAPIAQYISATTVDIAWSGQKVPITDNGTYNIAIDYADDIVVASNGATTLGSNFGGSSGDYNLRVAGSEETLDAGDNFFTAAKYKNFGVQFRTGHLYQEPLKSIDGTGEGNTAITTSLNNAIGKDSSNTGTDTYTYNTTTLGLSAAQAAEADEVRFLISYQSLINYTAEGKEKPGKAWYKIEVRFTNNGSNFTNWIVVNDRKGHIGQYTSTFTFDEYINLEQYRPAGAIDWEVRITRASKNDVAYENSYLVLGPSDYTSQTPATIVSATTTIKELLNYPLTSVARVQFNSQDFSGIPSIGFHCRGMKVLVPSNYITREEASNGVASYKRNVSTGAVTSSYQNWDGNFRAEKVYTNNPAWIFYDILVNNRYGLGSYLTENDIDKYALYRIARYCDELVDNGNGGEEPRFTTNVWLTKATDAYKLLKDLATVFRGMLYWLDGEIVGVIDQASDAVYNFSSSNVINGDFSYESTGSKTRANQIGVTWNNPLSDYKPEVLLIEDSENIAKTGKIIREEAVAFGATSEGQALRYGRWKLWTAKNQTEIVAFSTAINAAFLRPGDIVNVQDPYRHPPYQTLSGRISSSGTRNTTTIPLDREITLQADSTYELNVLIEEAGAFLSQDSATISSTAYTVGDLILGVTSELNAGNVVDDSGNPVQVVWKKYTRVETQTVSTFGGSGISSLTVSSPFSTTPNAQTVWVLRRALSSTEIEVLGTKEEYKILSITQNEDTTYNISAVKHYNEKFNAVDKNWILSVEDPVYPPELADDFVPPPANLYLVPQALDSDGIANDVTLYWDIPLNSDGTVYNKIESYELYHNLENVKQNPIYLPAQFNTVGPYEFPVGTTTITIATVSKTGKKSKPTKAYINIGTAVQEKNVPRINGVARGGVSNSPISLSASNIFEFTKTDYTFNPIGAPDVEVLGSTGAAGTYSQDVSNIPSISSATWSAYTTKEKLNAAHFILVDSSSTSNPLKLIKWYEDSTLGINYYYNSGNGNTSPSSHWSAATGTISIAAKSNKITGSSTTFTSDFEVGDYVKIGTSNVAKISYIGNNTTMFIDRSFSSSISGETIYAPSLRIDKNTDSIIAGVRNVNNVFKLVISPNFTVVADPENYRSQYLTISGEQAFKFEAGSSTPTSTTITLTATLFGGLTTYDWEYWTGSAWTNLSGTQNAQTYSLAYNNAAWGSNTSLRIRCSSGGYSDEITIVKLFDGSAYSGFLTNESHTVAAASDGTGYSLTGSGGTFKVYQGTTDITTSCTFAISGSSTSNGLTASIVAGTGVYSLSGASWTGDLATFTFTATYNSTVISTKTYTISKSKAGTNGANGADGADGTDGDDGVDGDRGEISLSGYLYYQTSYPSAPTAPTSANTNTMNFSTGKFGTILSGWGHNPPTFVAGNTNKYWYVRYAVAESGTYNSTSDSYSSETITIDSTATQGIGFSGLVTFSGSSLTDGPNTITPIGIGGAAYDINTNITTIDGGQITTGSITALQVQSDTITANKLTNSNTNTTYNSGNNIFSIGNTGNQVTVGSTNYCATGYFYSNTTNCSAVIGEVGANSNAAVVGTSKGNNTSGYGGFFGWSSTNNYSDSGKNKVFVGGKSYHILAQDGTTTKFSVTENGTVVAAGNVTAYSDIRLKDDIELIEGAVTKCMTLRGVTFRMKGHSEKSTGLIAQEVRRVLPEAVTETEDGVLTLAYGNMAGLFVEAIKELQDQISELKREVKRLKDGSSN